MVLILSNRGDTETNNFIKTLISKSVSYKIISKIDLSKIDLIIDNNKIEFVLSKINDYFKVDKSIDFVFFRNVEFIHSTIESDDKYLIKYIEDDIIRIRDCLLFFLESLPHFGSLLSDIYRNKVKELLIAKDVGFKLPKTVITNNKETILKEISNKEIILKNITNPYVKIVKNKLLSTEEVKVINVKDIPNYFLPSCIQHKICSRHELRVFLWKNYCYGISFLKENENDIDWRHLQTVTKCEYTIPIVLEKMLIKYAQLCKIETGSFDIILDDNEFIFIECNPLGNFDFVFEVLGFNIYNSLYEK